MTLKDNVRKAPPLVQGTRADGSSYSAPNRVYEQIMLQMIRAQTALEEARACRAKAVRQS